MYKRANFPLQSFKISGISHYQEYCKNINIGDKLTIQYENNEYDDMAIAIYFNNNKIGYVPRNQKYCLKKNNDSYDINEKLIVIYKNEEPTNNNMGFRVICECFYDSSMTLQNFFT
jgi:hypothetical protein